VGVCILIATLIGLGVTYILPQWSEMWWLHVPLTCWLSFVVIFFYWAAVMADPGGLLVANNLHGKLAS
jgi:hypothetical protein